MALPAGISTATVTFGTALQVNGALGSFTRCRLSADRKIIHAGTGTPIYPDPVDVTPTPGQSVSFEVPHVDQPGFVDASGAPITGWHYVLESTLTFPSTDKARRQGLKPFQVLVGQDQVDLDQIPDGLALPPTVAPTAVVTSIAGLVGQVTAEDLAAKLDGLVGGSGGGVVPSPTYPGFFDITGGGLTPDPDHPGYFLIGA